MQDKDAAPRRLIQPLAAAVLRRKHDGQEEFVCMATCLADGVFVSTADALFPSPHKTWPECHEGMILRLLDGTCLRASAIAHCDALPPLLFIRADGPGVPVRLEQDQIVDIPELYEQEFQSVYRVGYSASMFGNPDLGGEPVISTGTVMEAPHVTPFRGGADPLHNKMTIAARANFDYPTRCDYGSPVVVQDGRLAGVLVGSALVSGFSHQGVFIPIELILPFAELFRRAPPHVRIQRIYHYDE